MQRAIFESMGQKLPSKPKPVQQQIPKELMGEDMMDQSFYGDLDI